MLTNFKNQLKSLDVEERGRMTCKEHKRKED